MKHFVIMSVVAAALVTLTGCENKQQNKIEFVEPAGTEQKSTDVTLFGVCGEGSAMNTLQLLTDSGDSLSLNIESAKESNRVLGSYAPGDRIAVLATQDMKEIKTVINESTLMGKWLMPNPIDGSSYVGIFIKDGGIAESIDQSTIVYKTWRIVDGKLEISLVREGGGDEEETNLYDIEKLNADSLVYFNEDDKFEYSRSR